MCPGPPFRIPHSGRVISRLVRRQDYRGGRETPTGFFYAVLKKTGFSNSFSPGPRVYRGLVAVRLYPISSKEVAMIKPMVWALAVGLVAVCLWQLGRGPVAEIVGDDRENWHWQQEVAATNPRSAMLKEASQRIWARYEAKQRIARDLIDGRLSVNEAASKLAALPDPPANFLADVRRLEPGQTDHERLCWHIIDYACEACDSESEGRELRRRLTLELETTLPEDVGGLSLDCVVAQ
jgi:hypothetical protein